MISVVTPDVTKNRHLVMAKASGAASRKRIAELVPGSGALMDLLLRQLQRLHQVLQHQLRLRRLE